jgi:coenzyme F420-reducing hydrogenase delta subunit
MRLDYPASVKIVRVPCTGKVDVIHLLRALERGADGACVIGCMEGDCHFNSGNLRARKRVEQARRILDTIGIGGQRVEMFNLSSSEAPLFVKHVREMNDRILALGPNPVKAGAAQSRSKADIPCAAAG